MKDWIILTVVISLVSSVFTLILPECETKKTYGILVGTVMVFVILLPFKNGELDSLNFDFDDINIEYSEKFSESSEEIMLSAVESGFENTLLQNISVFCENIESVNVFAKNENGEYIVEKVEITLTDDSYDERRITEAVYEIVGRNCKVIFISLE